MSFDLPGTESLESSYSYREERERTILVLAVTSYIFNISWH